eukprot:1735595-Prymnesium_polylepis.2
MRQPVEWISARYHHQVHSVAQLHRAQLESKCAGWGTFEVLARHALRVLGNRPLRGGGAVQRFQREMDRRQRERQADGEHQEYSKAQDAQREHRHGDEPPERPIQLSQSAVAEHDSDGACQQQGRGRGEARCAVACRARDRDAGDAHPAVASRDQAGKRRRHAALPRVSDEASRGIGSFNPVSYTHLTLPTICSV